jgi:hypothetical protein
MTLIAFATRPLFGGDLPNFNQPFFHLRDRRVAISLRRSRMSASLNHSDNGAYHHDKSSRRQWRAIVLLALLSLVLGAIGFARANYPAGDHMGAMDAIYNSMRLFHMHFDHVPQPLPWELQIARFLAPLVLGVTLLKGFVYAAHSHRHAFVHRSQSGHVVVCGLGQKGLQLAREYRRQQLWVVIVEKDGQNEFLSICDQEHIHCIIGDAAEPAVLKEARVEHAGQVIVVTPDRGGDRRVSRLGPWRCHRFIS